MRNAPHRLAALSLLLPLGLAAQAAPRPADAASAGPLPPLLPDSQEVALALSAAPPDVTAGATVYVLRRGGFVKARAGTDSLICLVQRDHPESLYPICYDAEASRTILPIALREQELREGGRSEEEVERTIAAELAAGRFTPPRRVAVSYMMSAGQVLYAGARGRRVGAWHPHVMLYVPGASAASYGLGAAAQRVISVGDDGKPTAHLVVKVPRWSDGRASP
jgi:hypothetical protein